MVEEKTSAAQRDEDGDKDEDILEIARERFKLAAEAESDIRRDAESDLRFSAGDQWPDEVRRDREIAQRPCLTINKIPQFIRQITNDQRQNRPSIKVFPVDDKGDIETAKVLQGLFRHIEYNSNADLAYDTAFDGAVRGGRGAFRIITDYVSPQSFDQEILIKRIRNPFTVYFDPSATEPDGSDMNFCFIVDDLTEEEFKKQFPKAEKASLEEFQSVGDDAPMWMPGDKIRIAEYFYRESKEMEICLLSDGSVVEKSKLPKDFPQEAILQTRTSHVPVIKWCKLSALEVLEEREWVGQWIPVVPVIGEELDINGKLILKGVVRDAVDSQRMYNYWKSTETETIALAPKSPWVVAEGQIEGHEQTWKLANRANLAFLPYKPTTIAGQAVPPPQRQVFEPPVQAITMASREANEDIKGTTGIYDASLGARSNETSGIAIQRRNVQAQTANFHFVDNLTRSLRHAGRIIVDLIPKIYDTQRAARIIGEDGEQEIVRLNEMFKYKGEERIFRLSDGKYDVVVETGPSYATKRQEAVAAMLEMTSKYPQIAQVAGDLMVKNMEWPGAQEIAERLKKTLPPGVIDDKNKKPLPPEVQAQMQQMDQMIQALTKQLNEAQDKLDTKAIELESKERIEMAKIQANIEIEMAKMGSKEAVVLLQSEIQEIQNRLSQLNYNSPFPSQHEAQEGPAHEAQEAENFGGEPSGFEPPQSTGGFSPGIPNQMEQPQ